MAGAAVAPRPPPLGPSSCCERGTSHSRLLYSGVSMSGVLANSSTALNATDPLLPPPLPLVPLAPLLLLFWSVGHAAEGPCLSGGVLLEWRVKAVEREREWVMRAGPLPSRLLRKTALSRRSSCGSTENDPCLLLASVPPPLLSLRHGSSSSSRLSVPAFMIGGSGTWWGGFPFSL